MDPNQPKGTVPPAGKKVPNPGFAIGLVAGAVMIAYFLIVRWLGFAHHVNLRLLNFVIMLVAVVWSLRKHANLEGRHYDYMSTLGNGCLTALTASAMFGVFLFAYLLIDQEMMNILHQHAMFGSFLTPLTAAAIAAGEEGTFGIIMAYVAMFYVNNRHIQTTKP
jgi:hypothetical protein